MKVKEESENVGLKLNIQKTKIIAFGPITSWQIDGETMGTMTDFIFCGSKITADGNCSHEIKRCMLLGRKAITNLDSILKAETLLAKVHLVKYVFSGSHVWMWELDYKESWAPKNWSFWTVVLEKTLESPLDSKEIQSVNPKGNQSWIFIGRTDAEAETPLLWPTDVKNWHIGKDPDAGKDWRWEEKGMTEDELVGWHHWFDGHEFEQVPGVGDGQGSLVCCSPWGQKELDMTEWLNWTEMMTAVIIFIDSLFCKNSSCWLLVLDNNTNTKDTSPLPLCSEAYRRLYNFSSLTIETLQNSWNLKNLEKKQSKKEANEGSQLKVFTLLFY